MSMNALSESSVQREELLTDVRWYIGLRWRTIGLLGLTGMSASWFVFGWSPLLARSLVVVGLGLSLNGVFWLLSRNRDSSIAYYYILAIGQLLLDVLLVAYLSYSEGTVQREVIILYAIPILVAGVLFGQLFTYVTASVIALLHALILSAQFLGIRPIDLGSTITPPDSVTGRYVVPLVFFTSVFFVIASAASFLAQRYKHHRTQMAELELVGVVTRQLRASVTAIEGHFALLSKTEGLTNQQRHYMDSALAELSRQMELINRVLQSNNPDDPPRQRHNSQAGSDARPAALNTADTKLPRRQ